MKTEIKATIILDSVSTRGERITTFLLTFPRFILAELNTHRMFSRNSASSRAIPFKRMIKAIEEDPFIPIAWQKDHQGMQGNVYYSGGFTMQPIQEWLKARDYAMIMAKQLNGSDITKQLCNRLLEPYMWHTALVTATEFENFFALRCPQYEIIAGPEQSEEYRCVGRSWKDLMKDNNGLAKDFDTDDVVERLQYNKGQAEIHMMALAESMWDAYNESEPQELLDNQWHIPYGDKIDKKELMNLIAKELNKFEAKRPLMDNTLYTWDWEKMAEKYAIKISTAMCARTSYTTIGEEKEISYERLIQIHDAMYNQNPFHASPFEHVARAMETKEYLSMVKGTADEIEEHVAYIDLHFYSPSKSETGWCDNFKGFISYRHIVEKERRKQ